MNEMRDENIKNIDEKEKPLKMKIPKDIQKEMLEFFIHTSIPRKKAKDNRLLEIETGDFL